MKKRTKVLAIILGVAVVASVAIVGGIALAAGPQPTGPTTSPSTTSPANTFLSKLAANLNVSVDKLEAAMTQARTDTLNEMVANGMITSAQKDWIQNRIQQAQQNGYGPGIGPGFGCGFGPAARGFAGGPFNGTPPWGGTPPWSQTPAPAQ